MFNFPLIARALGRNDIWLKVAQETVDSSPSWEARIAVLVNVLSFSDPEQRQRALASPELHGMLEQVRLPEYWRAVGWPKECRAIDETEFSCG
jgi:hypothetical protein